MFSRIVTSAALLLALALPIGVARAQSSAAIAQSLFDEGRKLLAQKRYDEACPRLERSYALDPAGGTLLNVAVCHEAIGKTATAWDEFRDALTIARRENRGRRVKFAQEHIAALKPRLCTLTVKQDGKEQGLEWKIDGTKMGAEALGIALPIDPGSHVVEAGAPGMKPWSMTVEVRGNGQTQSVDIPALVPVPSPKPEPPPPEPVHVAPVPVIIEKSRGPSPWVFVTGTIGVLGFGALALGGVEALSSWNDRKAACGIGGDPNACTQAGIDADQAARNWALVADIGLGVGAAATIATIVIAAVGRGKTKETRAWVVPLSTPHAAGVGFGLMF